MRTTFSKMLNQVVVLGLTVGVLRNWVGAASTTYAAAPPQASSISVPAGTRILVRLAETLSSAQQRSGARFTGRLETNVTVGGTVVAPQGATVHGQVVSAQSAGRMAGGSELANRPAIVDVPVGRGHVVMFATNPMWRHQTQGEFFLLFNAVMNYDNLGVGRSEPSGGTRPRSSAAGCGSGPPPATPPAPATGRWN